MTNGPVPASATWSEMSPTAIWRWVTPGICGYDCMRGLRVCTRRTRHAFDRSPSRPTSPRRASTGPSPLGHDLRSCVGSSKSAVSERGSRARFLGLGKVPAHDGESVVDGRFDLGALDLPTGADEGHEPGGSRVEC